MAKNKNRNKITPTVQKPPVIIGISNVGKKVIAAGILLLALGFFVLTKTDPSGQNLASIVSPFMILGGYAVIAIGIAIPVKNNSSSAD